MTNNKYIDDFNSSTSCSSNFFLAFSNQYGHALLEPIPYRGNKWFKNKSVKMAK